MPEEIIILESVPPRIADDSEKNASVSCTAERFDASTRAGLLAARRKINAMLRDRFGETVDEE